MRRNQWFFAICAVVLLGVLLLCWHTMKHSAVETTIVTLTEPKAPMTSTMESDVSVSSTMESDVSVSNTIESDVFVSKEKASPITENPKPNTVEVENAIEFLKNLEKRNASKEIETKVKETKNTAELSQDEMYQLIYEGVSYYDSLLESGSVNFVLEISDTSYPGMPSLPGGTWEGSFEFSNQKVRGSVKSPSGTEQFAYDGETFQNLYYKQSVPRLTQRNEVVYTAAHDPRFWGWNLSGKGILHQLH